MKAQPTAQLHAEFAFENRTRLTNLYAKAPLKIAKTFQHENALSVCIMDASPGLLAGDFYDFEWHLSENSQVHITTQGFTRVHPSQNHTCLIKQKIRLEKDARLELFPEPLMLYENAALRSETHIEIASGATLLMGEIFCAGRIGRGEKWAFHSYENRLRVELDGEPIYLNQSAFYPQKSKPQRVGVFENFTHGATCWVFSPQKISLDPLRALLEEFPNVYSGVSRLEKYGFIVSLLGHRAHDLQSVLAGLRAIIRDS